MAFDPITAGIGLVGQLIDKVFPDKEKADAAKLEMLKMQQTGELETIKVGMSVMLAEAQSADPWTSRARPSFLYVMYIMILAAIPMGILSAFSPEIAARIATGLQAWLAAIPEGMWATFGLGYSGYAIARSYDKCKK